jgi:DNA (cytosine-5)-methyltransferase 1
MTKPPYRVPSMAEIEALPWNGYRVASTFSGCGGSCLGYRMAGYRVVYANEFIEEAQRTYKANHPNSYLDTRDIRQVRPEDVMEKAGVGRGELDLLDGSPPCSAFSTAGKREAGWGKVKSYSDKAQRVDDLFFEYVRLLDGIRPKVFVAENVSGLVKGTAKGYFKRILAALKEPGYRVSCRVLDAQWLGVPQMRQRTIFVGVREDLGIDPAHPEPLPYRYSVRDAIPWIDRECDEGQQLRQVELDACMKGYAVGREWEFLRTPGTQSKKYFQLVRPSLDAPCPTITQRGGDRTVASVCHPTICRKFSIAELRRICGFPDDFQFSGAFPSQYERMGRAVPPVMMSHIASTIATKILNRC